MCEMCEMCESKEAIEKTCCKCQHQVGEDRKCLKPDCDGYAFFLLECSECGKVKYLRPEAWVCEDCIIEIAELERGMYCEKCNNRLNDGECSKCS